MSLCVCVRSCGEEWVGVRPPPACMLALPRHAATGPVVLPAARCIGPLQLPLLALLSCAALQPKQYAGIFQALYEREELRYGTAEGIGVDAEVGAGWWRWRGGCCCCCCFRTCCPTAVMHRPPPFAHLPLPVQHTHTPYTQACPCDHPPPADPQEVEVLVKELWRGRSARAPHPPPHDRGVTRSVGHLTLTRWVRGLCAVPRKNLPGPALHSWPLRCWLGLAWSGPGAAATARPRGERETAASGCSVHNTRSAPYTQRHTHTATHTHAHTYTHRINPTPHPTLPCRTRRALHPLTTWCC